MSFKLTTRLVGEVTVVDLAGRLELGEGPGILRETLRNISAGGGKILLNLSDLSFIDTAGLGELASGHAMAQTLGRNLKLTGISKRVGNLFEMTGLDSILDIYGGEPEAIHSWGGPAPDALEASQNSALSV